MKKLLITISILLIFTVIITGQSKYFSIIVGSHYIVKDNATKLLWTKCALNVSKTIPDGDCSPSSDIDPFYPATMTWNDAITACGNLVYAGRSDWRLPTAKELISILYYTNERQYVSVAQLLINIDFFPNNRFNTFADKKMSYWTATQLKAEGWAWMVMFDWGEVKTQFKTDTYAVRCVAGPVKN